MGCWISIPTYLVSTKGSYSKFISAWWICCTTVSFLVACAGNQGWTQNLDLEHDFCTLFQWFSASEPCSEGLKEGEHVCSLPARDFSRTELPCGASTFPSNSNSIAVFLRLQPHQSPISPRGKSTADILFVRVSGRPRARIVFNGADVRAWPVCVLPWGHPSRGARVEVLLTDLRGKQAEDLA